MQLTSIFHELKQDYVLKSYYLFLLNQDDFIRQIGYITETSTCHLFYSNYLT